MNAYVDGKAVWNETWRVMHGLASAGGRVEAIYFSPLDWEAICRFHDLDVTNHTLWTDSGRVALICGTEDWP